MKTDYEHFLMAVCQEGNVATIPARNNLHTFGLEAIRPLAQSGVLYVAYNDVGYPHLMNGNKLESFLSKPTFKLSAIDALAFFGTRHMAEARYGQIPKKNRVFLRWDCKNVRRFALDGTGKIVHNILSDTSGTKRTAGMYNIVPFGSSVYKRTKRAGKDIYTLSHVTHRGRPNQTEEVSGDFMFNIIANIPDISQELRGSIMDYFFD